MKNVTKILKIINLLSAVVYCHQQHQNFEVNLIDRLNEFFGFDHNLFLLDSLSDRSRYIPTDDDGNGTTQTVYIFDENLDTEQSTQLEMLKAITSKKTFLIIVGESSEFGKNQQLRVLVKSIRRLQVNVKIGVFFARRVNSMDNIKSLFQWSWSVGITNIFCSFQSIFDDAESSSFNVVSFNPFRTFDLINVTVSASLQNFFPDKVPNYQQDLLRFANVRGAGVSSLELKFWRTVVHVFNASTSTTFFNPSLEDQVLTTDIVIHERILEEVQIYPHRMTTSVLLVPHAQPYSGFIEYLKNTTWELLFAYSLIAIVTASLVLTVSGYLQTRKILFFQCVSDVVNLLLNDNGTIRYGQRYRADVWVIVPFTFTGLIVVNGILSLFQSYLTLPIYERQINTIDELYKSSVPILANEMYWANRTIQILENLTQYGGWSDKVIAMNLLQLRKEFHEFNNSIAIYTVDYDGQQVLEVQKRLSIKAFHLLTEMYLEKYFVSYQLNYSFPFTERINEIIHRLQSAGLIAKWFEEVNQEAINNLWRSKLSLRYKTVSNGSSDSGEFIVPTVVWCGWIASVIVFGCEIVWNKIKLQIQKLKLNIFG